MKYRIDTPDPIPFSKAGLKAVSNKLDSYTKKRKVAVEKLRVARAMGDLSENAAYTVARLELNDVDRQIRNLTYQKRFGFVQKSKTSKEVGFGSKVTIERKDKKMSFTLVGNFESNPYKNKLSLKSPIGQAVMGKKVGEDVFIETPKGKVTYRLTSVEQ